MESGTHLVMWIIAAFLGLAVFLLGAILLKLDTMTAESRRRLGHIEGKLTRMEVDHVTRMEANPHTPQGRQARGRHAARSVW